MECFKAVFPSKIHIHMVVYNTRNSLSRTSVIHCLFRICSWASMLPESSPSGEGEGEHITIKLKMMRTHIPSPILLTNLPTSKQVSWLTLLYHHHANSHPSGPSQYLSESTFHWIPFLNSFKHLHYQISLISSQIPPQFLNTDPYMTSLKVRFS